MPIGDRGNAPDMPVEAGENRSKWRSHPGAALPFAGPRLQD
jgi:hypothetical protein